MSQPFSMARRLMIPLIIAAVVLLIDQISKAWVLRTWATPYSGEIPIIPGLLALTYVQNTGVAFGLFTGMSELFIVTSLIIVALAIGLYLRHGPQPAWVGLCLGLIVGGALGNVIDRLRFGYVVDFIKTFDGRFPVFNVADSCVVIGVTLLALGLHLQERQQQPRLQPSVDSDDGA
ncbi:signal peptidase II [Kallotenue papyrolyticum]|uniref:signal peptidase II n=1 Tax=Kallotenue papyrolyticum TaxID=1325125 RepID=UPI0009DEBD17|nr:signal peptidase II [Kallotenue papyrolyticum]